MIPKSRLDALTDGVFAFAMTLLVLGLDLPPSFQPKDNAELIATLRNLDGQFLAYFISFFVLGLRWLGHVRVRDEPEKVCREYALWALIHLFFVTCLPFSTMVVGNYDDFTAAVWIYAANMAASALAAIRLSFLTERETGKHQAHTGRLEPAVFSGPCFPRRSVSAIRTSRCMPTSSTPRCRSSARGQRRG